MDRADAYGEFRIEPRPCGRRRLTPRIVAAGGDSQYPAHGGNPVDGLIRAHELERRDGTVPVSVANQAAAFAKISRSSRSTRFSRRSRLSSVRSSVVKPSLRRPSSSPACLTHFRMALADGSNSRASSLTLRPARANSMIRRRSGVRCTCDTQQNLQEVGEHAEAKVYAPAVITPQMPGAAKNSAVGR